MADALYLGIDFGTSGCRAVAITAGGAVAGGAAVALPAPRRSGAAVEQHPALWWQGLTALLAELARRVPLERVRSLALDGTSATVLLADERGVPLGPALMYNDARAGSEAARVAQTAPADSAAFGPTATLAKLLWLQARDAAGRARYALHQADWLAGRLTGLWGVSDENNALKLGWDPVRREWPDWLARLGVPGDLLPRVLPPGTPVGPVCEVALHLGLSPGTQVVAGTTDSTAAFLATGAREPGEAVTSLGSTLVLKVVSERPVSSPAHGVYSHRLGARWLAGGASNSGGAVLRQHFTDARMGALSASLDPARTTGLDYYPLPAPGERFPVNDPKLAPRMEPRPADDAVFFQGLLEGIARIEQRGYALLAELGAPYPRSVRSVGGGADNPAWTAMRARLLGVPVLAASHQDAAYGAALLALRSHRA